MQCALMLTAQSSGKKELMSWPNSVELRMLCQKCKNSIYSPYEMIKNCKRRVTFGWHAGPEPQFPDLSPCLWNMGTRLFPPPLRAEFGNVHHPTIHLYKYLWQKNIWLPLTNKYGWHTLSLVRGMMTISNQRRWPGGVSRGPVLCVMVESVALVVC